MGALEILFIIIIIIIIISTLSFYVTDKTEAFVVISIFYLSIFVS